MLRRGTTFIRYILVLLTTIVATAASAAHADDCRYQKTAIEETICADKWLIWNQGELDNLYRRILRRLDQGQRDQLILDQERWSDARGPKCANKVKSDRERCIFEMIEARSALLSKKFPASRVSTDAPDQKPFEGHWERCQKWNGADICSYYTLYQKGNRICGLWQRFATNSFYQGRLVWAAKNNVADSLYICGRVGGEVSHWCPDAGDAYSPKGWQATTGTDVICSVGSVRFLSSLDSPCTGPAKPGTQIRHWRALDAKQRELPKVEKWLQTCLEDPNYPDKADIVAPVPR